MDKEKLKTIRAKIEDMDQTVLKENAQPLMLRLLDALLEEEHPDFADNVNVYTAPAPLPKVELGTFNVFLAGGITGCWEWQKEAIQLFNKMSGSLPPGITLNIFNPRREDFPMDDPNAANEQIWWEQSAIMAADTVLFWFTKDTVQPIVLLELGRMMEMTINSSRQMVVGVEKGYVREHDVLLQVYYRHPRLSIHNNLEDVVASAVESCTSMPY